VDEASCLVPAIGGFIRVYVAPSPIRAIGEIRGRTCSGMPLNGVSLDARRSLALQVPASCRV
jgi:hypothetical protein